MIIQTGMRTDIPAFYAQWLANRLEAGYVLVRNPYNPSAVTRYRLAPDVVDLIAFCTKNPEPMLSHMDALKPYGQYWFVTITPYGREIEPGVPPKARVLEAFKRLSRIVGVNAIGWRYDPVFIDDTYTLERHVAAFERMASALSGYTRTCVVSFIDLYPKVRRNFPGVRAVSAAERRAVAGAFVEIGRRYDMAVKGCAEGGDLAALGVDCGGCMTADVYERALGCRLRVPNVKSARPACGCLLGSDIGAYDTCGHLCRYCYANDSPGLARRNLRAHDPASPFLLGGSMPGDVTHEARQASWIDRQVSMF